MFPWVKQKAVTVGMPILQRASTFVVVLVFLADAGASAEAAPRTVTASIEIRVRMPRALAADPPASILLYTVTPER